MAKVINTTFQVKRGLSTRWVELNPVLAAGEPGYELDTHQLKVGDGSTPWVDLPYIGITSIYTGQTKDDFPEVGYSTLIYKAEAEAALYQWNSTTKQYEKLSSGEGLKAEDIKWINGGAALIE